MFNLIKKLRRTKAKETPKPMTKAEKLQAEKEAALQAERNSAVRRAEAAKRRADLVERNEKWLDRYGKFTRRAQDSVIYMALVAVFAGFFFLGLDLQAGNIEGIIQSAAMILIFLFLAIGRVIDMIRESRSGAEARQEYEKGSEKLMGLVSEAKGLIKDIEDAKKKQAEMTEVAEAAYEEGYKDGSEDDGSSPKKDEPMVTEISAADLPDELIEALSALADEKNAPKELKLLAKLITEDAHGHDDIENAHREMLEQAMTKVISDVMDDFIEAAGGKEAWKKSRPMPTEKEGEAIRKAFKKLTGHDATVEWVGRPHGWKTNIDTSHDHHSHEVEEPTTPNPTTDATADAPKSKLKQPPVDTMKSAKKNSK